MTVYTLSGVLYEGSDSLLGVYSTQEKALEAEENHRASSVYEIFDEYWIGEFEMDAFPETF